MCQTVFKVLRILYERKQIKPCSCGVCILIFRDSYTAAIEQEDGQTACLLPEAKLLGEWKSNRKRFLGMWHRGKEAACQCWKHERRGFDPWVGKIPWSREWQPTVVFPLEHPVDSGAWWATFHGVAESDNWATEPAFCGALPREGRIILEPNFSRIYRKYIFSLEGSLYCPWRLDMFKQNFFF